MNIIKKFFMRFKIPKGAYCDGCPYLERIGEVKLHKNPPSLDYQKCEFSNECDSNCWGIEPSSHCINVIMYCKYLDIVDDKRKTLLYEACKECGVKDDF